jgi:hypothetical protein
MPRDTDVVVEFGNAAGPTPTPITPTNTSPKFTAKKGSPRLMRIITMSRAKTTGSRGSAPHFTQWANREVMCSDTMSAFAPMYKQFANEFAVFNHFKDPQKIAAVVKILETPRTHDIGLIKELEAAYPGITQALYSVLLPQYSRGEGGVVDNFLALGDSDILQRFNAFGFGTQLRAEMLTVIHNSQFFKDIDVDIKDKDIKIFRPSDNVTLVEGHVDEKQKLVTLKINSNVDPADRDDAIKHLLMMAACHTQQNDSNTFIPTFGDNIYENIRLLQLAIGEFNLRIPQSCIDSQLQIINAQIAALPDPEKQQIQDAWNFWADRVETFKDKVSIAGTKIVDNDHRPQDSKGRYLNLENTQEFLRQAVTESIFPATGQDYRPALTTLR